ncbi:MAG: wax ester/triacylglycerol synthase family O-acyltransferase [Woeseia sp.]|nr:wax ester/triacylglycerol synthase family O-acyltransferase [Woeseia sp.]MBT8095767.1 wax ester/triacylglycerol synthase family O-acyltransferase [Woeseia sp.]NNL55145.1 wax ester/triacylglycerol synthase family O-acyltransferase [Woeseia sp.]
MQQLSGLDSSFLYMETGATPMHIGSIAIYDQSTAPDSHVTFKQILKFFEDRLHKARAFRQRLVKVPLSLDHPYWIEDPDFDLEFHVRHIALPKPGDWRQLCIETARIHARPLDMRKPLWEAWVIEGLDNVEGMPKDSFALLLKIHHAAIDGVSGAQIAEAIHDLAADSEAEVAPKEWSPERIPTGVELLTRSVARTVASPIKMGKLVARSAPSLLKVAGGLWTRQLKLPIRVPRTRFNGNVSSHRVFDGRVFDLDKIKAIKNSVPGTTVNDVVVGICGGALRRYLESRDELPDTSLVAMAPMSVRAQDQMADAGNLVTAMSLPVRSDIADPLRRLMAISEESQQAKRMAHTMGPRLGADAAEFLPSTMSGMFARMYANARLSERMPPLFNTVITNIPGVGVPLYSMGSRLVASWGLGPIYHGLGLFQPVVSYNGTITISAIADRDMMPDPAFYSECLQIAFDELYASTVGKLPRESAGKKSAPKKKAKTKAGTRRASNGGGRPDVH